MATIPKVSFEFFPPKNEAANDQLWTTIRALEGLRPRFVSVTYGAGGTTRVTTFDTVCQIRRTTGLEPVAHLTCVNHTKAELAALAKEYWDNNIRHIIALRGDIPGGEAQTGDFRYASELVGFLKSVAPFDISVAAYPEKHPEAASVESDIDNLKRKFDQGADRAITQYFFNSHTYLDFLNRARRAGITLPIIPGILPVSNFAQVLKFSNMCGASVPSWMQALFQGLDDRPDTRKLVAAMVATEQCRQLLNEGIDEFHFYTLNRSDLTLGICQRLGLKINLPGQQKPGISTQPAPLSHDPDM